MADSHRYAEIERCRTSCAPPPPIVATTCNAIFPVASASQALGLPLETGGLGVVPSGSLDAEQRGCMDRYRLSNGEPGILEVSVEIAGTAKEAVAFRDYKAKLECTVSLARGHVVFSVGWNGPKCETDKLRAFLERSAAAVTVR
jgi:hypothetical protein